tara:strand:- start:1052 stop:1462 length:411 start_codon:yes stop_codon:yes gene_type:complete
MENEELYSYIENGQKYLQCKGCYEYQKVDDESISITCGRCTIIRTLKHTPLEDMIPSLKKKQVSGRPPGWHFMNEFVDKDGNVFHKGKEQPELKGTLKPTKVKPVKKRKKLTKDEKMFKRAEEYKKKLKAKRKNKK